MNDMVRDHLSKRLRCATIAIVAIAATTAPAVHANSSERILVVPPTGLPELARQTGEAMLLRDTTDGRALLYVEQQQGARLAIFNVTDPVHIKGEGSVQLNTSGTFDFMSPIGGKQELIQFWQGGEGAVLDFHKEIPNLKAIEGLTLRGSIAPLGSDGLIIAGQDMERPMARDYQVVDIASDAEYHSVFDVKHVRAEVSKADTGTTFLLADDGLYIVRRPTIESDKRRRDQEWFLEHSGE
jgi:hypothetical protein